MEIFAMNMDEHQQYWSKKRFQLRFHAVFCCPNPPFCKWQLFHSLSNGTFAYCWEVSVYCLSCDQSATYYVWWAWPKSSISHSKFKIQNPRSSQRWLPWSDIAVTGPYQWRKKKKLPFGLLGYFLEDHQQLPKNNSFWLLNVFFH